jgi:hypothetical protein
MRDNVDKASETMRFDETLVIDEKGHNNKGVTSAACRIESSGVLDHIIILLPPSSYVEPRGTLWCLPLQYI